MSSPKPKKAYFSVHALRDGIIWFATLTRKPNKRNGREPDIDEDGIHNWFVDDEVTGGMTDWGKALRHGAVANVLNLKRVLRQQIEPKLDEILERLVRIEERLADGGSFK